MYDAAQIQSLQQVARYRAFHKLMRANAIAAVAAGVLLVLLGGLSSRVTAVAIGLALLGGAMLVVGIAHLVLRHPVLFLVDGALLILAGVAYSAANAYSIARGVRAAPAGIFFAVFQIFLGFHSFNRYRQFANLPAGVPPQETIKWLDDVAKHIRKAPIKTTPNVLLLTTTNMFQGHWRIQLSGDLATFVDQRGHEILLASRDTLQLRADKPPRVEIKIGERVLKGSMGVDALNALRAWQANPAPGGLWVPHA